MADIATLHTDRLILRGVTEDDIDNCQRYFNDYEIIRHLAAKVPWPYPADGARTFIQQNVIPIQGQGRWVWGLHRKNAEGLIGIIDLWRDAKPENRGFWLARPFWGQGYMTEAVTRVTDYAFDELDFQRLILSNAVGNFRSRNVKVRRGATPIGTAPRSFVDPTYTHHELWELTKQQWQDWKLSQQL